MVEKLENSATAKILAMGGQCWAGLTSGGLGSVGPSNRSRVTLYDFHLTVIVLAFLIAFLAFGHSNCDFNCVCCVGFAGCRQFCRTLPPFFLPLNTPHFTQTPPSSSTSSTIFAYIYSIVAITYSRNASEYPKSLLLLVVAPSQLRERFFLVVVALELPPCDGLSPEVASATLGRTLVKAIPKKQPSAHTDHNTMPHRESTHPDLLSPPDQIQRP
jgi:hypothetical protein